MLFDTWPRNPQNYAEMVSKAFPAVEWITIFFVGLLIVVGALQKAVVLEFFSRSCSR
jgi:Na+/H+ antiporter NhaD/arsenite permease-like protein